MGFGKIRIYPQSPTVSNRLKNCLLIILYLKYVVKSTIELVTRNYFGTSKAITVIVSSRLESSGCENLY